VGGKRGQTLPPLAATGLVMAHPPGAGAINRLRLLSFNIQTGIAVRRYHDYVLHGWKHLLPHAKLLDNLNAIARLVSGYEIVALQEVDAGSLRTGFINQTEYLAHHAGFPFWYSQTNRNLGRLAQVSIGFLGRMRPTIISEHRLPSTIPGRGAMVVRLGREGPCLHLVLVHLSLSRRSRLRQIRYLTELVNRHPYVVVMGDFNFQRHSPEMVQLLRDTHLQEPAAHVATFPSWRPQRTIDHILVSEGLEVDSVKVLEQTLSDHLPIAMEITLPSELRLPG
jgi:endonuclease/exonuclease/phosphatase family metal-dependent hydrolase